MHRLPRARLGAVASGFGDADRPYSSRGPGMEQTRSTSAAHGCSRADAFARVGVAALATVLLTTALTARAGAAPVAGESLALEQALDLALRDNRELAAFDHMLAAEEGRLEQAGLLGNPQLELELEDTAGSGRYAGFDLSQTTLSLAWVLEGWIRRRRVEVAEAGEGLTTLDARILQLDVAAETAHRFVDCLANQARLEATDQGVALAGESSAAVARRERAGRASSADRMRADAELATARLLRDHVEHELAADYRRLAAQWGDTEPRFSRVAGDLLDLPATRTFAELSALLGRSPQLLRLASEERLAVAKRKLEEARRWPTWRPVLGVRRYDATGDYSLRAQLNVDLPVFDRNQGQLAASRAVVARTRADAEAARVRVRTTLFEMYEELEHHRHRAEALRDVVVPRLTSAMEEVRRGYERGRYGYLEWRLVRAELIEAKISLIDASAGAHRLVISLERLTGERVVRP